ALPFARLAALCAALTWEARRALRGFAFCSARRALRGFAWGLAALRAALRGAGLGATGRGFGARSHRCAI
ncbi:MAG: hypothetical protein ACK58U_09110, partial [Rubrivivax sp.]